MISKNSQRRFAERLEKGIIISLAITCAPFLIIFSPIILISYFLGFSLELIERAFKK